MSGSLTLMDNRHLLPTSSMQCFGWINETDRQHPECVDVSYTFVPVPVTHGLASHGSEGFTVQNPDLSVVPTVQQKKGSMHDSVARNAAASPFSLSDLRRPFHLLLRLVFFSYSSRQICSSFECTQLTPDVADCRWSAALCCQSEEELPQWWWVAPCCKVGYRRDCISHRPSNGTVIPTR